MGEQVEVKESFPAKRIFFSVFDSDPSVVDLPQEALNPTD